MRRLTIFTAAWQPVEGGAERQLRQLADLLAERDWSVTVIAGGPAHAPQTEQSDSGVRILRVHDTGGDAELPTGRRLVTGALWAARTTDAEVVLGSLVSGASVAAMAYGRIARVPCVLRIGGHDFNRLPSSKVGLVQGRFLVHSSSAIVVNAPHLIDQLKPFMPRRRPHVTVIRNGVATSHSTDTEPRSDGPLRVIYYTNAGPAKNDKDFLRAVVAMPETQFRAIGRTHHLPQLRNLEARGWCAAPELELDWADVVLNTSLTEGSPNFCLQGLALGRRVVGFANAGVVDLADQYPSHVTVVPIRNVGAVVDALRSLENVPLPRTPLEVPSLDQVALQWEGLLKGLAR